MMCLLWETISINVTDFDLVRVGKIPCHRLMAECIVEKYFTRIHQINQKL